ncbi:MAG: phenylalanine--tRNA ligase subunit beta [Mangrovibacterium sp.]
MNISYKWLKDYIDTSLTPNELESILTQVGLEVGGIEEVESIKGGLRGLVIGEVLSCEAHPDSDHLSKTTVNLGDGIATPIVCGASNVAKGQKVVVATVGTTLYDGDKEFTIKKSKIRGEVSEGMICAEDEIGLGNSHEGIMVLPSNAIPGTPASEYFNIESDYCIEVDLTPNRIDAASHIGVARDLAAYLAKNENIGYTKPSVEAFQVDNNSHPIAIELEKNDACHRYAGLTISGVEVKESPDWLKNRLKTIGLNPVNNIVDVTNYVMFETAQPLHAFDMAEIKGNKIIIKTLANQSKFTTLDGVERKLNENDLMICSESEPLCIAGVFGGIESGVKNSTQAIFLESACFDPIFVRKTARFHGLNTDASFRFERGTDPNGVIYALKRAALLIQQVAGGKISSNITDIYPTPIADFKVDVSYSNIARLIGKDLGKDLIKRILCALEIKIENECDDLLSLAVPPYRVDVKREADIVEEILRIYGYNNVEIPTKVNATLQYTEKVTPMKIRNKAADILSAQGFREIWSNSLTKSSYYENREAFSTKNTVNLFNPLSADLGALRQSLLFNGLETIAYNANRKNGDLKIYELGNCYSKNDVDSPNSPLKKYNEEEHLGIFISGKKERESWAIPQNESSFFQLKSYVENLLSRLGINIDQLRHNGFNDDIVSDGLIYTAYTQKELVKIGIVSKRTLKEFGIDKPVFFADINMNNLYTLLKNSKTLFSELPKYPEVRRDLALLIDKNVSFNDIVNLANKSEKRLLRRIDLFDVYEGKGIPEDKKSYAVSFILRDDEKTLNEQQIEKIMHKLIDSFEKELQAKLR